MQRKSQIFGLQFLILLRNDDKAKNLIADSKSSKFCKESKLDLGVYENLESYHDKLV